MALIGPTAVAEMVGVSYKTVIRMEAAGLLPPAKRVGERSERRWEYKTIEAYVADQERGQDFAGPPPHAKPAGDGHGDRTQR